MIILAIFEILAWGKTEVTLKGMLNNLKKNENYLLRTRFT